MLTATLLGLILGCVRWRSNSVLPGMALHLVHNVMLIVLVSSLGQADEEAWKYRCRRCG